MTGPFHAITEDDLGPCVLWTMGTDPSGYGRRKPRPGDSTSLVHRQVYEEEHGAVPEGLTVEHKCHTLDQTCQGGTSCLHRRCINLDHLTVLTRAENTAVNVRARATHCKHGHEFTPENTYFRPQGGRDCRRCVSDRGLKKYYRQKAKRRAERAS